MKVKPLIQSCCWFPLLIGLLLLPIKTIAATTNNTDMQVLESAAGVYDVQIDELSVDALYRGEILIEGYKRGKVVLEETNKTGVSGVLTKKDDGVWLGEAATIKICVCLRSR